MANKPTTMKPSQVAAIRDDLFHAEEQMTHPEMSAFVQDKVALRQQIRKMKETLDREAPQPYETGAELDTAVKRVKEIEETMKEGMLSELEMKRNRGGSANRHNRWENANKKIILERKELLKRIHHDSDDPDLTSYENLRPYQPFGYDPNAQIPGVHMMSEEAKRKWPLGEPKAQTAVSHVKESAHKGK